MSDTHLHQSTDAQTAASLASLQNRLSLFVANEHEAQRSVMRRLWALPTTERVEEGRCIENLRVASLNNGLYRLTCDSNDSRFREGDFVRISRGDPQFPLVDCHIVAIGDQWVDVTVRKTIDGNLTVGDQDLCLDESFFDLERLYQEAIADLGKSAHGRDVVLPLLQGSTQTTVDAAEFEEAHEQGLRDGLNDRQAEAVANATACDPCWLIQGPPGTGKTRVLAWVVTNLLNKGERVLVTSFTHRAINNLLSAIAASNPDSRRIGRVAPFRDPLLPAVVEQRECGSDLSFVRDNGGYVIGATPFALRSSQRLGGYDFDTVVIDEASQVTLPLAVMALLAGKRFILAGDHQQLPPVCVSLDVREAINMSIFGRLVNRGFDTTLNITHRLNDQLCEWPSDTFYKCDLTSHPRAATKRLSVASRSGAFAEAFQPEPSTVWFAIPHHGCRTHAPEEVSFIAELLLEYHAAGLDWKDIGVVVPYRRQARHLRRRLASRFADRNPPAELVIDTVERMQGQERELIIVSFATSDEQFAEKMKHFLFLPQRLNVAATRPRTKLILVASPGLFEFAQRSPDDDSLGCFVSLLQSAHRVDVPLPGKAARESSLLET